MTKFLGDRHVIDQMICCWFCPVAGMNIYADNEIFSGKLSQLQLQNLGRWAQMESSARYFLPREKEQVMDKYRVIILIQGENTG